MWRRCTDRLENHVSKRWKGCQTWTLFAIRPGWATSFSLLTPYGVNWSFKGGISSWGKRRVSMFDVVVVVVVVVVIAVVVAVVVWRQNTYVCNLQPTLNAPSKAFSISGWVTWAEWNTITAGYHPSAPPSLRAATTATTTTKRKSNPGCNEDNGLTRNQLIINALTFFQNGPEPPFRVIYNF